MPFDVSRVCRGRPIICDENVVVVVAAVAVLVIVIVVGGGVGSVVL